MSGRDLQFLDSLVIAASSDDGDSSKNIQVIIADTTKKKLFQELTSHILSPSGKATETTKKLMTDLGQGLEAGWMDKIKRNASLSPEQQSFLSLIASEINVIKSDTITLIFNYNLFIDILFTLKSDNILSHEGYLLLKKHIHDYIHAYIKHLQTLPCIPDNLLQDKKSYNAEEGEKYTETIKEIGDTCSSLSQSLQDRTEVIDKGKTNTSDIIGIIADLFPPLTTKLMSLEEERKKQEKQKQLQDKVIQTMDALLNQKKEISLPTEEVIDAMLKTDKSLLEIIIITCLIAFPRKIPSLCILLQKYSIMHPTEKENITKLKEILSQLINKNSLLVQTAKSTYIEQIKDSTRKNLSDPSFSLQHHTKSINETSQLIHYIDESANSIDGKRLLHMPEIGETIGQLAKLAGKGYAANVPVAEASDIQLSHYSTIYRQEIKKTHLIQDRITTIDHRTSQESCFLQTSDTVTHIYTSKTAPGCVIVSKNADGDRFLTVYMYENNTFRPLSLKIGLGSGENTIKHIADTIVWIESSCNKNFLKSYTIGASQITTLLQTQDTISADTESNLYKKGDVWYIVKGETVDMDRSYTQALDRLEEYSKSKVVTTSALQSSVSTTSISVSRGTSTRTRSMPDHDTILLHDIAVSGQEIIVTVLTGLGKIFQRHIDKTIKDNMILDASAAARYRKLKNLQ